ERSSKRTLERLHPRLSSGRPKLLVLLLKVGPGSSCQVAQEHWSDIESAGNLFNLEAPALKELLICALPLELSELGIIPEDGRAATCFRILVSLPPVLLEELQALLVHFRLEADDATGTGCTVEKSG